MSVAAALAACCSICPTLMAVLLVAVDAPGEDCAFAVAAPNAPRANAINTGAVVQRNAGSRFAIVTWPNLLDLLKTTPIFDFTELSGVTCVTAPAR